MISRKIWGTEKLWNFSLGLSLWVYLTKKLTKIGNTAYNHHSPIRLIWMFYTFHYFLLSIKCFNDCKNVIYYCMKCTSFEFLHRKKPAIIFTTFSHKGAIIFQKCLSETAVIKKHYYSVSFKLTLTLLISTTVHFWVWKLVMGQWIHIHGKFTL